MKRKNSGDQRDRNRRDIQNLWEVMHVEECIEDKLFVRNERTPNTLELRPLLHTEKTFRRIANTRTIVDNVDTLLLYITRTARHRRIRPRALREDIPLDNHVRVSRSLRVPECKWRVDRLELECK